MIKTFLIGLLFIESLSLRRVFSSDDQLACVKREALEKCFKKIGRVDFAKQTQIIQSLLNIKKNSEEKSIDDIVVIAIEQYSLFCKKQYPQTAEAFNSQLIKHKNIILAELRKVLLEI
ncbi:hypothetical protein HYV11_03860 [Candidatus Dependentiae bacterium]|nr:hypothetical protein [Candidatus Dependentiae bacterium]